MNSSLHNYLVNGQMARNKVRVKGIEILSAPSPLSTDIFVDTQFGDTNRKPRSSQTNTYQSLTLIANPPPQG